MDPSSRHPQQVYNSSYYGGNRKTDEEVYVAAYRSTTSHNVNDYYGSPATAGLRQRRPHFPTPPASGSSQESYEKESKKLQTRKIVRKLDIFTKIETDMTVKTERGGMITLISYIIIGCLVLAEFITWKMQNAHPTEHVVVETSLGKKMRINLNITFPDLACEDVHVDVMDVAGDSQVSMEDDTFVKRRLHLDGTPLGSSEITAASKQIKKREEERRKAIMKGLASDYCGPCYGAQANETDCCQTCDDVISAYKVKKWNSNDLLRVAEQCLREGREKIDIKRMSKGEGCNLDGYMLVNRVAGNFHIAMGEAVEKNGRHVHQFIPEDAPNFNVSHIIHQLSFGLPIPGRSERGALDGVIKIVTEDTGTTGLFQYFLKVVPTYYKSHKAAKQAIMETNRFFVTERFRPLMTEVADEHYALGTEHNEDVIGVHAGGKGGGSSHAHHEHHKIQNAVLPGIFFVYDIYPFALEVSKTTVPLSHLLIRIMAVVGGVISLTGIVISFSADTRPRTRSV